MSNLEASYTKMVDAPTSADNENSHVDECDGNATQAIEFEYDDEALLQYHVANSYTSLINYLYLSIAPTFILFGYMFSLDFFCPWYMYLLLFFVCGFSTFFPSGFFSSLYEELFR